jgi:hypothetical protein
VDSIDLVKEMVTWWAAVNAVIKRRVPQVRLMTFCLIIGFPRRSLVLGIRSLCSSFLAGLETKNVTE